MVLYRLIFLIGFFSHLSAGFPEIVVDIYNNSIDVIEIVEKKNLIIITLKNPRCPVCQNQLIRIRENFNKFALCNVSFLVLTSGENSNIEDAQIKTEFPFPFINDINFTITDELELRLNENEIIPSLILIDNDLNIKWKQLGRNQFYFGDKELLKLLDCENMI